MRFFKGLLTWELWIRKAGECFKGYLMCYSSRNMKDSGAECDLNWGCLTQEVSEEKNINMWSRDYIL